MSIPSCLQKHASQHVFTHAVVALGYLDKPGNDQVFTAEPATDGSVEAIFDLASLTKALVTTPLCFHLVKQQTISFSSTVGEWLRSAQCDEVLSRLSAKILRLTVGDLLRHTSGLPAWHNFHINSEWEKVRSASAEGLDDQRRQTHGRIIDKLNWIADQRLELQPQHHLYSDVGFILLGLCLELTRNSRIDQLFETFLKHLNFDSNALKFGPSLSSADIHKTVSTGHSASLNKKLIGIVHDENAASFGGVAPHAGLFGSVTAVTKYLRTLWRCDDQLGIFAINSNLLGNVVSAHKEDMPSSGHLLGLRQGDDEVARAFCQGLTLGHYGFTGTAFWIEPNSTKFVVLLTNRVHFGYFSKGIAACRREIFTLANQILQNRF